MRVVEIDSLQLNSSLDTKIGTNDRYLQLLRLSHTFPNIVSVKGFGMLQSCATY